MGRGSDRIEGEMGRGINRAGDGKRKQERDGGGEKGVKRKDIWARGGYGRGLYNLEFTRIRRSSTDLIMGQNGEL